MGEEMAGLGTAGGGGDDGGCVGHGEEKEEWV